MLGDTIRFGADSPTFRVEVKEKEADIISPRKTLSTVHDIEVCCSRHILLLWIPRNSEILLISSLTAILIHGLDTSIYFSL